MIKPVWFENNHVYMIDQLKLPHEKKIHSFKSPQDVVRAIETMIVRGAPAIGVTAAFGLSLAAIQLQNLNLSEAQKKWLGWCDRFSKTRPTAVNLFWAIDRMKKTAHQTYETTHQWAQTLIEESKTICAEDISACQTLGQLGAELIKDNSKILTHCNAGALATAGWGSALGIVRSAIQKGKKLSVWVNETRPFLQGSRLTAWELMEENIPATLITDTMAGYFFSKGEIDAVIVGADRIAKNGDTANKIGTYTLSILAKHHNIPFFVAAPHSTIDAHCENGKGIPIEERNPEEVKMFANVFVAPINTKARHPAFDVTPFENITALITENGVFRPPFKF